VEPTSFDGYVVDMERLLRGVARIVKKRGRDILAAFDITPPQLDALLHLKENGDITMGELCQKMYLACSTATDLSDRMERSGLIVRQRDSADRRVIRLHITELGDGVIKRVMQARREYLRTILTKMDDTDKQRLIDGLGQIHTLMTDERVK